MFKKVAKILTSPQLWGTITGSATLSILLATVPAFWEKPRDFLVWVGSWAWESLNATYSMPGWYALLVGIFILVLSIAYLMDSMRGGRPATAKRLPIMGRHLTRDDRLSISLRQGNRCASCGSEISLKTLSLHHVVPVAEGGAHDVSNLQGLCVRCNSRARFERRPNFGNHEE